MSVMRDVEVPCPRCRQDPQHVTHGDGRRRIVHPAAGTGRDPDDSSRPCRYCGGSGRVKRRVRPTIPR